ncbi:MAG: serine hydrolase domain-containing protein [Cyclobacteriaceae bacterium]
MMKISSYLLPFILFFHYPAFSQDKEFASKVENYIRPYVSSQNFSGSILISRKGKIVFSKAYGYANQELKVPTEPTTVFHLASISKTFTAAAVLMLEQKGLLTTGDTLSKYIPDFPSASQMTIHHLLAHTSGITDINDLPEYDLASLQQQTPASLVALLKTKPLEFQPGEKYSYTSSNYALLALIIEQVSGMTYGDYLKENIFKPLKMNQTWHHANMIDIIPNMAEGYDTDKNFGLQKAAYMDWSSKAGGGSLVSTTLDLAKWNAALFGISILSEKSKKKMFTEYVESGYGWYIGKQFDKDYILMNGRAPGVCTHMGRYPEDETFIIVLSNINVYTPRQIATDLAGILFNKPVDTPNLDHNLSDGESRELVGKYQFGEDFYRSNYLLEVTSQNGKLLSNYGELVPNKPYQFFQRSYWLRVSFNKNAAGNVDSVTIGGFRAERAE